MSEDKKTSPKQDYTNGMKFFPWLWKYRKMLILGFALNVFFGYKAYEGYFENGEETVTLLASIFFGICVPTLIAVLTVRDWRGLKRGIVR